MFSDTFAEHKNIDVFIQIPPQLVPGGPIDNT